MNCPLCGYEFDETEMTCHTSCAFNKSCAVICCPNCGYQQVDLSRSQVTMSIRAAFQRLKRRGKTDALPSTRRLSDVEPGQSGTFLSVGEASESLAERLAVLGVTPGASFTLAQRIPAYVLQVGYTELSLERGIADAILVELAS